MFKQMKNIDTVFRHIRSFTLVMIGASFLLCCFVLYKSFRLVSEMQSKVNILASDKVLDAYASDREDNIAVEARDHVKAFHQFFFRLDPDDKVIQTNITKALYLADASANRQYDNCNENGYYNNVIAGNISQTIQVGQRIN